ncbi:uncharacterized protein LOC126929705 isoform X2 [Macaca thibetana thibetana]|uniref:uncharacterized protein LOC126929705 isoform X2 n=1 Tax=Macaca thibetana thibetana TaxID=257877 RepID=UPI0021BC828A|nr:uncharacterized protein LOC126929705 isoform X2 [Macaca thibetana thibetana]
MGVWPWPPTLLGGAVPALLFVWDLHDTPAWRQESGAPYAACPAWERGGCWKGPIGGQPGPPLASMWVRLLIAACFGPVSVALTLLRKCLQSICAPRPSPGPAVCSSCPTQHKHSTRIAPNVGVLFIKCLPIAQVLSQSPRHRILRSRLQGVWAEDTRAGCHHMSQVHQGAFGVLPGLQHQPGLRKVLGFWKQQ